MAQEAYTYQPDVLVGPNGEIKSEFSEDPFWKIPKLFVESELNQFKLYNAQFVQTYGGMLVILLCLTVNFLELSNIRIFDRMPGGVLTELKKSVLFDTWLAEGKKQLHTPLDLEPQSKKKHLFHCYAALDLKSPLLEALKVITKKFFL